MGVVLGWGVGCGFWWRRGWRDCWRVEIFGFYHGSSLNGGSLMNGEC